MIKFRGLNIKVGDSLKVNICEGVEKQGVVIFNDAAYCLEYEHVGIKRNTPLTNYAYSCKFKLINNG
jgi:hypothetical protein